MSEPIIDLPPGFAFAASRWHGGQSSKLYAVASTGSLSYGTIRPTWCGVWATDEQWDYILVAGLEFEIRECLQMIEDGRVPSEDLEEGEEELLRDALTICERYTEEHEEKVYE